MKLADSSPVISPTPESCTSTRKNRFVTANASTKKKPATVSGERASRCCSIYLLLLEILRADQEADRQVRSPPSGGTFTALGMRLLSTYQGRGGGSGGGSGEGEDEDRVGWVEKGRPSPPGLQPSGTHPHSTTSSPTPGPGPRSAGRCDAMFW